MPDFTIYSPYRRRQFLSLFLEAITRPVKVLYILDLSRKDQKGAG